ncbi:MAG: hypothetical protein IH969_00090 [Candidatus Krumholzibacteriota bacterium]|nr:hypothetical protein [Candidatus Krumholzibacteriota bacterium]
MQRYFLILTGLLALAVCPALADQIIYYPPSVTGKKARSQIRHYLYAKNLVGEKKAVYESHGYTPHRLRFNHAGRVTERWQYLEKGLEFTFDQKGNIIDEREITREDRRGWVYQ